MGVALALKKLERVVSVDEVRWGVVIDRLSTRFQLPYAHALSAINSFHRRVRMFYPIGWILKQDLSPIDNEIVLCLSEILGADGFTLYQEHNVPIGIIQVRYSHSLGFSPGLREPSGKQLAGRCTPELTLQIFGKTKKFGPEPKAIILYLLLIACAILSWLVFVQTMLFGLAIFVLTVHYPHLMVEASLRHYSWGFGLILFVFGFVGLFGSTLRFALKAISRLRLRSGR